VRAIRRGRQFKKDFRQALRRNKDMERLKVVITLLVEGADLPEEYRGHSLKGRWKGFRECHMEPDWLLIYRIDEKGVELVRTGTHADLFE